MAPTSARSLITPLEPGRAARAGLVAAARPNQAVYANAFRRLEAGVASTCGSMHDLNEDAHSLLGGSGRLFVVADGVGGGALAQLASRLLVARLHDALEAHATDARRVEAAVLDADRAIADAIARSTDRPGAATFALCAPADAFASRWLVAWVGDCRVYRWSPRAPARLTLLTRDDTFANLGEPVPAGGAGEDPARMVGNGATDGANVALHELARGELLALCSDGVHKPLDGADWCATLALPLPLAQRAAALVATARARGSTDDATVLLLQRADAPWRGLRRAARGEPNDANAEPKRSTP